jgi:hypothetical protein
VPNSPAEVFDRLSTLDTPAGVEQITTPNAQFLASSRPFLESVIRRRTLALPNPSSSPAGSPA